MSLGIVKGKIKNYLTSDYKRKISVRLLVVIGVILTFMGIYGTDHIFTFITALGVALFIGTTVGSLSGERWGWPMGLWLGLLGGAILSPWVTRYMKGAEGSYYAAILGPLIGALIGRWTELKDKRGIERATFKASRKSQKLLQKKE